jgi:hypothetical protein
VKRLIARRLGDERVRIEACELEQDLAAGRAVEGRIECDTRVGNVVPREVEAAEEDSITVVVGHREVAVAGRACSLH